MRPLSSALRCQHPGCVRVDGSEPVMRWSLSRRGVFVVSSSEIRCREHCSNDGSHSEDRSVGNLLYLCPPERLLLFCDYNKSSYKDTVTQYCTRSTEAHRNWIGTLLCSKGSERSLFMKLEHWANGILLVKVVTDGNDGEEMFIPIIIKDLLIEDRVILSLLIARQIETVWDRQLPPQRFMHTGNLYVLLQFIPLYELLAYIHILRSGEVAETMSILTKTYLNEKECFLKTVFTTGVDHLRINRVGGGLMADPMTPPLPVYCEQIAVSSYH
ncbi:hypothetical protein KIN20_032213 [Parelaphostrongylus tenuis]|uniref:Uncharacterized protein n=1 Tax=Parelaphostrongylus tenuis TaxID=148309 RepID=A0AAD5R6R4_PARTN|nr:hypothetical protein KIN20_032213 [Parelaphostrongylus tenuis]